MTFTAAKELPAVKKSVAINLLYRHPERTLKEEDVKDNIAEIIKKAEEKSYTLRA